METRVQYSWEQVEAFVRAARLGSFSAAARELGKAQSAVSTAIANLEADLGVNLFDRAGHLPVLTPEGEALLGDAERLLARGERFGSRAATLATGVEPRLVLAVDELAWGPALVDRLTGFAERWPDVEMEFLFGIVGDIALMVAEGRAHMGIMVPLADPRGRRVYAEEAWRDAESRLAGLDYFPAGAVPALPVVAAGHPLAGRRAVSPDELEALRQLDITSRGGERPDALSGQVWRVDSYWALRDLVRAGLGWAYLPESLAASDLDAGRLVRLDLAPAGEVWRWPLYLVRDARRAPGPAARWLLEALAKAV
jgi:DNA-binding transcriptional LysR family regulator